AAAAEQVEARARGPGGGGGGGRHLRGVGVQVGQLIVHRGAGCVRLQLVDFEAELLQVALAVLVRHRVDGERVGGGQRVGRHDHTRRVGAPVQAAEDALGAPAHHQVRRLQQYLV